MEELESCLDKVFEEEVDSNSSISECLMAKIGSAVNAACDFSDIKCTVIDSDTVYTTKNKSSSLIVFGIGGAGGGGGGAQGSVINSKLGSGFGDAAEYNYFTIQSKGLDGSDGADGTSTTFDGLVVAEGGKGGKGGGTVPPGMYLTATRVVHGSQRRKYTDPIIKGLECERPTFGGSLNGVAYGESGQGGLGSNSYDNKFNREQDLLSGHDGYKGQAGNFGMKCISVTPSTDYNIVVGKGGAGGLKAPDTSFGGNIIDTAEDGTGGTDGAIIIYEFGF